MVNVSESVALFTNPKPTHASFNEYPSSSKSQPGKKLNRAPIAKINTNFFILLSIFKCFHFAYSLIGDLKCLTQPIEEICRLSLIVYSLDTGRCDLVALVDYFFRRILSKQKGVWHSN